MRFRLYDEVMEVHHCDVTESWCASGDSKERHLWFEIYEEVDTPQELAITFVYTFKDGTVEGLVEVKSGVSDLLDKVLERGYFSDSDLYKLGFEIV